MKFNKSLLLTKKEQTVLEILQKKGVLNYTELSLYSGVPRTSLYKPIKDLKKRNFVTTEKRGRDRVVIIKNNNSKNTELKESIDDFIALNEQDYIYIMYASPHINKGDRVYWLQPSLALQHILRSENIAHIINLNKKILQSQCIVDGILECDYYEVYKKMIGENKFKVAAKSLLGRPYEIHMSLYPFKDKKEVIIFSTYAIIFDWQTKTGIKSQSNLFIDLCKSYFDSVKQKSKKVDVSELLRTFI